MAGYLHGVCAKAVVVLVSSENGDDEVEMVGRHCLGETGIVLHDGGMGVGNYHFDSVFDHFLRWFTRDEYQI